MATLLPATFHFVENALDDAAARVSAAAQNASRQAMCETSYISNGAGQIRLKAPFVFPIIFATEPHFTTGSSVVKNPDPKVFHDPIGNAGVYNWQRDKDGLYTGAFIWVRVDVALVDANATTEVQVPVTLRTRHYMTFSAVASLDVTADTDYDATLTARNVGT